MEEIIEILKDTGKLVGNLPNVITVSDELALEIGDLGSALILCGIYLRDFRTTTCEHAGRKYIHLAHKSSAALYGVADRIGNQDGVNALLLAQQALRESHAQFTAHLRTRLASIGGGR